MSHSSKNLHRRQVNIIPANGWKCLGSYKDEKGVLKLYEDPVLAFAIDVMDHEPDDDGWGSRLSACVIPIGVSGVIDVHSEGFGKHALESPEGHIEIPDDRSFSCRADLNDYWRKAKSGVTS
jgi:hypothetical protein